MIAPRRLQSLGMAVSQAVAPGSSSLRSTMIVSACAGRAVASAVTAIRRPDAATDLHEVLRDRSVNVQPYRGPHGYDKEVCTGDAYTRTSCFAESTRRMGRASVAPACDVRGFGRAQAEELRILTPRDSRRDQAAKSELPPPKHPYPKRNPP